MLGEAGFFCFWRLEADRMTEAGCKKICLNREMGGIILSTCLIRHFKASEVLSFD